MVCHMNDKNAKEQNKLNTTGSDKKVIYDSRIAVSPFSQSERTIIKKACRSTGLRRPVFYRQAIIDKALKILSEGLSDVN